MSIKFVKNDPLSFGSSDNNHLLLIGDNKDSLEYLLLTYKGNIKCIYIDPPYGCDGKLKYALTTYNNKIKRQDLLEMLRIRLILARELLSDDGVFFCSIDDRNQAYVKCLFDEIFGEENFIADFIRKTKSTTNDAKTGVNYQHEFLLCYAKNSENVNLLGGEKDLSKYKNPDNDPNGAWVIADPSAKSGNMKTGYFAVVNPYTGKTDYPPKGMFWRFSQNTLQDHINAGRICFKKDHKDNERGFIYKRYLKDLTTTQKMFDSLVFVDNAYMNQAATKELKELDLVENFAYPKGVEFLKKIIEHSTNEDSIILDFFAGSGTTGHAVLELNREDGGHRKFILCQNNEKTATTPNGIAYDVTAKRLKRVMTGECYDGTKPEAWLKKHEPYGGAVDVLEYVE